MSEAKSGTETLTLWQRLLAGLLRLEEAVDFSYDDVQDKRIAQLEKELAALKSRLEI